MRKYAKIIGNRGENHEKSIKNSSEPPLVGLHPASAASSSHRPPSRASRPEGPSPAPSTPPGRAPLRPQTPCLVADLIDLRIHLEHEGTQDAVARKPHREPP